MGEAQENSESSHKPLQSVLFLPGQLYG
jgi:hypothetical protein